MQYLAQEVEPEKMQVVSFHPGNVYTQGWVDVGVGPDFLPFDDGEFAFLRGRDVSERQADE